jgi:hypothetical protein
MGLVTDVVISALRSRERCIAYDHRTTRPEAAISATLPPTSGPRPDEASLGYLEIRLSGNRELDFRSTVSVIEIWYPTVCIQFITRLVVSPVMYTGSSTCSIRP